MEIVDVNVKNLREFDIENDLYHDVLWENMFDDGEYTDDGCNEAVGFIYSNACHAEVYGNAMCVTWIKDSADKIRLAMVANDLAITSWAQRKRKSSPRRTTEPRSLLTMAYISTSLLISRCVTYRFSLTRKPKQPSSEGATFNQLKLKI